MTTRTSSALKQAFERFVELVKPIEDVCYVVARDDEEPEIAAYITKYDDAVTMQVIRAQIPVIEEFPDLIVDFRVWYMEGRPIESFVGDLPRLTYVRSRPGQKRDSVA